MYRLFAVQHLGIQPVRNAFQPHRKAHLRLGFLVSLSQSLSTPSAMALICHAWLPHAIARRPLWQGLEPSLKLRTGLLGAKIKPMAAISKFGRRYDREFKQKAVALVLGGRSQGEVSRDLGVSAWSLGEWVKKAKAGERVSAPSTLESESAAQRELRQLRQENEYLRQQREILKKPWASYRPGCPAAVHGDGKAPVHLSPERAGRCARSQP